MITHTLYICMESSILAGGRGGGGSDTSIQEVHTVPHQLHTVHEPPCIYTLHSLWTTLLWAFKQNVKNEVQVTNVQPDPQWHGIWEFCYLQEMANPIFDVFVTSQKVAGACLLSTDWPWGVNKEGRKCPVWKYFSLTHSHIVLKKKHLRIVDRNLFLVN